MGRIVVLTETLRYGGATKILIQLAEYLSAYHEVMIAYYGKGETFYNIDSHVKVIPFGNYENEKKVKRVIKQVYQIRKILKSYNADVIIAFGNKDKLLALMASVLTKTKTVISERQDPYNYIPGNKRYMWMRYILASGCVFQTEGAAKYFPKLVQRKSVVIPNFIQCEQTEFTSILQKKKEIVFSARFELRQKRQDIMIRAFSIIHEKYPEWKLVFYGDGADEGKMVEMAKQYGLNDSIVFNGKTTNVLEKIKEASIFAITSDFEGIPNALLEAMAIGMPSVSTDCNPGGARILIQDGKNGLLVPTGDYKGIALAIIRLIEDPQFANAIARKAIDVRMEFSPEKILPIWKEYIEKIIKDC